MNLGSTIIQLYCKDPEQLIQIVSFVPGSQTITMRIGRIVIFDENVLVLKPHNNELAARAYGGDINAKFDIHEAQNIKEILVLSEDEVILKKIIADNLSE